MFDKVSAIITEHGRTKRTQAVRGLDEQLAQSVWICGGAHMVCNVCTVDG